jgi:hypothetical protein
VEDRSAGVGFGVTLASEQGVDGELGRNRLRSRPAAPTACSPTSAAAANRESTPGSPSGSRSPNRSARRSSPPNSTCHGCRPSTATANPATAPTSAN